jgi:hypothetical protein
MTTLHRLRQVLKAHGPGHTVDDLKRMGFSAAVRDLLTDLQRRGEATRFGAYWWLKVREPKSFPKQPPPPRPHPIETALNQAGIQEENGHIVKRIPRRKP